MAKTLITTTHEELKIDIYTIEGMDGITVELSNPNQDSASVLLSGKCAEELISHINGFLGILKIKGAR